MFRVLEVTAEGPASVVGEEAIAPPPENVFRWIDLEAQDAPQLKLLGDRFGFHPLAIEDCANFDQRPKVGEYGDHLFVVIHSLRSDPKHPEQIELCELHAFVGARYLVTVHTQTIPVLNSAFSRVAGNAALARQGGDFLFYQVTDAIVDSHFPAVDAIAEALDDIESSVIRRAERRDLVRIFKLKQTLVSIRKAISPQRDVFGLLARRGVGTVSDRAAVYFRDIYDHLVRISESLEMSRDLLSNCLDAYLSMNANRTNEIMKHLTVLSAIFLPLAFIVGFFGQNFETLLWMKDWVHNDPLMWSMVAVCVALPMVMFWFFKRRGWL